ncbi:hypothetical protein ACFWDP_40900, partial [Streptomyces anthocyanicus]|uniref:hypothetical protein n=1 Tax=Streptomyces anthocyanicus TaxID=68174 RepID=UPI0036A8D2D5
MALTLGVLTALLRLRGLGLRLVGRTRLELLPGSGGGRVRVEGLAGRRRGRRLLEGRTRLTRLLPGLGLPALGSGV